MSDQKIITHCIEVTCSVCGTKKDMREMVASEHGIECMPCIKKRISRPGYFQEKVTCACCGDTITRQDSVKTKAGVYCSGCYETVLARFFMRLFGHMHKKDIERAHGMYRDLEEPQRELSF